MQKDADIIVVGAGPAGSTAAKLLADRGYQVMLIDRAAFPRHKTCASWINRLAFERFQYLQPALENLVEAPFFGVSFYDRTVQREGRFHEPRPSGYLSLRSKFDDGLRRIAVRAGAEFLGGSAVTSVQEERDRVTVWLADGKKFSSRILVGADGASSRVAAAVGIRKGWAPQDYVVCANADIPLSPSRVRDFYGSSFPLRVYLEYAGIRGYGWVFPKRRHVCVGIGGLLEDNREIRPLFHRFFLDLLKQNHIPPELVEEGVYFDIDPVGGVYRIPSLTRGRTLLIGDAAGFVSGSTGEGIYPGMVSAAIASDLIHQALERGPVEESLARFNLGWRRELASYVRRLPGGNKEEKTQNQIEMIFRSSILSRMAGRIFLYGEPVSVKTLLRSFW